MDSRGANAAAIVDAPSPKARGRRGAISTLASGPPAFAWIAAGSVAVAALSLRVPSMPTFDPWAWIVWGREIAHFDLNTTGGPSWKPLPALLNAPLSLFGDAAPSLWIVTVRATSLVALALAWRLATRLAGTWIAGVVAVVGVLTIPDWIRYTLYGNIEPVGAALVLGAIERHFAGRRSATLVLGAMAALTRPELWPFLWAYAAWIAVKDPRRRVLAIAVSVLVPAIWIGGDWIGSGQPFSGSDKAKRSVGLPFVSFVRTELEVVGVPVLIAAIGAIVLAWRRRATEVLVLAAGATAFGAIVMAMTLIGYGGNQRYLIPAAAVICVVAGTGVGWAAQALGGGRRTALAGAALAAVIAATMIPSQAHDVRNQIDMSIGRAKTLRVLDHLVARVGRGRILACGRPDVNWLAQSELAWRLRVPLSGVQLFWNGAGPRIPFQPPSIVFLTHHNQYAPGIQPHLPRHGLRRKLIARDHRWAAYQMTAARGPGSTCHPPHSA
jgi:hypothetical protein